MDEQLANPRFYLDCTLGTFVCSQVDAAISQLQARSNFSCAAAGSAARARYNATGYGFRPAVYDVAPEFDAHVIMEVNWLMPSEYGLTDDSTYLRGLFFRVIIERQSGLLAHEQMHQLGWDNSAEQTGVANQMSATCGVEGPV